eukprot:4788585-Prymnesium_polylepis.2
MHFAPGVGANCARYPLPTLPSRLGASLMLRRANMSQSCLTPTRVLFRCLHCGLCTSHRQSFARCGKALWITSSYAALCTVRTPAVLRILTACVQFPLAGWHSHMKKVDEREHAPNVKPSDQVKLGAFDVHLH